MMSRILLALIAGPERGLAQFPDRVRGLLAGPVPIDLILLDETLEDAAAVPISQACSEVGGLYYRSPRQLGRVRAANLALRLAEADGYDYVVLALADVVAPAGLVDDLAAAAAATDAGVVMAWAGGATEYGLAMSKSARDALDRGALERVRESLRSQFHDVVFDVPSAAAPVVLVSVRALREVGLLDPVFLDYQSALTDWSLRSRSKDWRVCLAPNALVLHPEDDGPQASSSVSQLGAAVVDLRFPQFRDQLVAFRSSGLMDAARVGAARRVVLDGAQEGGYSVDVSWVAAGLPRRINEVRCRLTPVAPRTVVCECTGFSVTLSLPECTDAVALLEDFFGTRAAEIRVYDRGRFADELLSATPGAIDRFMYPTRI